MYPHALLIKYLWINFGRYKQTENKKQKFSSYKAMKTNAKGKKIIAFCYFKHWGDRVASLLKLNTTIAFYLWNILFYMSNEHVVDSINIINAIMEFFFKRQSQYAVTVKYLNVQIFKISNWNDTCR